jgi:hypothetical protein
MIPEGAAFTNAVAVQLRIPGGTWVNAGSGGADVALTGVQTLTMTKVHGQELRLLSAGNEAVARTVAAYASGSERS